jgi:hypothetical protein
MRPHGTQLKVLSGRATPRNSTHGEVAVDQIVTKSSLPPESARLVELMQAVNFGRIEGLVIRLFPQSCGFSDRLLVQLEFAGSRTSSRGSFCDLASV